MVRFHEDAYWPILIIAGASADASADESSDKFLKKTVFFTLFLIFLNSRPIQSLSKARSDPYWEEQSLQKINQSNTVFKQFFAVFTVFRQFGHLESIGLVMGR